MKLELKHAVVKSNRLAAAILAADDTNIGLQMICQNFPESTTARQNLKAKIIIKSGISSRGGEPDRFRGILK